MLARLHTAELSLHPAKDTVLSFPDLKLEAGKSLLLLGASGSGKTTLLSILAGLLPPTQGKVYINGEDLYEKTPFARDRLRGLRFGMIFQTLHLLPSLTVYQNIALAGKMAGITPDKNRIETLLTALGLAHKTLEKPDCLSQGERQRVAIARAVLNKPDILIADEPTSALDDENAAITINLIREQAKEYGASLLLATHDSRIKDGFDDVVRLLGAKDLSR